MLNDEKVCFSTNCDNVMLVKLEMDVAGNLRLHQLYLASHWAIRTAQASSSGGKFL